MPRSRRGTSETSMRAPAPGTRPAHSATDDVRPAAPRSCTATTASVWARSMHASSRHFSRNGLPTCTAGRRSELDSSSSTDAHEAVACPLRPRPHQPVDADQPDTHGVDERVLRVAIVEVHLAADRGYAD